MTNEEREEEIRQVEAEIEWLQRKLPRERRDYTQWGSEDFAYDTVAGAVRGYRILAREMAALAELKRGWK